MAMTAFRGEPSLVFLPNQAGSTPSSAIAARRRLAATVLPMRFVKRAPMSVKPRTKAPVRPRGAFATSSATKFTSPERESPSTQLANPAPGASTGMPMRST